MFKIVKLFNVRFLPWSMVTLLVCLSVSGCSRSFWREQSDRDSYRILQEKFTDARWSLPRIAIEPDSRSRFYNPYDPDESPLPPDDSAAHEYMHQLAGMKGYKSWHKFGQELSVENPHWLDPFEIVAKHGTSETNAAANDNDEFFPVDYEEPVDVGEETSDSEYAPECRTLDRGLENLTLDQSLELSYIHSREYQFEIEKLYLSALDLTFDRFQFDVRYLGVNGREPSSDLEHTSVPDGRNSLGATSRFGVSKLLPSGAQLAVELANNTLWLFSGQNQTSTASVISYSLTQPLLLGAGRKIVLEDLTQQERNVLYATRDLARFRKTFFTNTVASNLGLIQSRQGILNERGNIERILKLLPREMALASQKAGRLTAPLEKLPAGLTFPDTLFIPDTMLKRAGYDAKEKQLYWRGPMTDALERIFLGLSDDAAYQAAARDVVQQVRADVRNQDVLQLETRIASSRINLQRAEQRYQDSLDNYKIQLGLPPDMPVTMDNALLQQFELIDPKLYEVEQRIEDFVSVWAGVDPDDPDLGQLRKVVDELQGLEKLIESDVFPLIEDDLKKAEAIKGARLSRLTRAEDREQVQRNYADDARSFRENLEGDGGFRELSKRIQSLQKQVSGENLSVEEKKLINKPVGELREELVKLVQSLQVNQIGPRVELIELQEFTIPMDQAVCIGLENRLDLMNARAQVMDARRLVEIRANRLEAVLDIRAEGNINTPTGSRPLDFRGANSSFRAGISFTAPLDQVAERNAYRESLISYQRARRSYMATEDRVKREIRSSWRQLETFKINLENSRQSVRSSARQFLGAVLKSTAPGQRSGNPGLVLLNALRTVLDSQNTLIGIWVDYELSRLNIYRDMGIMDIDAGGLWVDDFYQETSTADLPPLPNSPSIHLPASADGPKLNSELVHEVHESEFVHPSRANSSPGERPVRSLGESGSVGPREPRRIGRVTGGAIRSEEKAIEAAVGGATFDADGERWFVPVPSEPSGKIRR